MLCDLVQFSESTCNQSQWFLCGASGWRDKEHMKAIQKGIGGRKKQDGPCLPELAALSALGSSELILHSVMGQTRTIRNSEPQSDWK